MSQLKRCSACTRELPVEDFDFKDKATGKRQCKCRACTRAYCQRHYEANKAEYVGRATARNKAERRVKRRIVAELKEQPCADCGRVYPWYVMQFDHRDPTTKVKAISNAKGDANGMPVFLAELAKCDILCANCHCIRTHLRGVRPDRVEPESSPESSPVDLDSSQVSGQREDRTPDTRIFSTDVDTSIVSCSTTG